MALRSLHRNYNVYEFVCRCMGCANILILAPIFQEIQIESHIFDYRVDTFFVRILCENVRLFLEFFDKVFRGIEPMYTKYFDLKSNKIMKKS